MDIFKVIVKFCSLRGEGRRGLKGILKNGVRMKSYRIYYNFENIHDILRFI